MTTSTYRTMVERQIERDRTISEYHIAQDPRGLKCPLCGRWSPLDFRGTQGVRLFCTYKDCGAITVMPRAPLIRAIGRREKASL